ncbi:unnamed protein product, partial [Anisakis simplex]|uniref:Transcriptional regulator n=1 Tax=Anisakis simplex TaxID=6269 RepID=A0A0M3JP04_ANISI
MKHWEFSSSDATIAPTAKPRIRLEMAARMADCEAFLTPRPSAENEKPLIIVVTPTLPNAKQIPNLE